MSNSAATSTINVIVSLHENELIEFKFLSEKLNWDNLVSLIQSSSTLEPPVILYYKLTFDAPVESLENQENLTLLLSTLESPTILRFYGTQEHVTAPVFVSSTAAFTRLGAFVDQNKQIVQSSRRVARWVGILASMMAVSDRSFEHEFEVLEKMIQRKALKLQHRKSSGNELVETDGVISAGEDEEFVEAPGVVDLDARLEDLNISGRNGFSGRGCRNGRGGKFGHGFGGRGSFGPCCPRPFEFFEGFVGGRGGKSGGKFGGKFGGCGDSDEEGRRGFAKFAGGRHHHGRPYTFGGPSESDEELFGGRGFGKFGGGYHHRHHGRPHPFGGPHAFGGPRPFGSPSDSEEEFFGRHHGKHFGGHGGHHGRGFGPRGPPPAFDSDEELFGRRGFGGHGFGGPGRHGKHHWRRFERPEFTDDEKMNKKQGKETCDPFDAMESEVDQAEEKERFYVCMSKKDFKKLRHGGRFA
ncbi:hypothetical protein INT46_006298 [Mucor plumbeus]|uniref:Uncharacterized protein n=1 Tax=Mucor plumbeus TaxID=97098 RepID=A0A8H7QQX3_9FUNG|nr:hypothetical protein INT46_006298 [Mucor plumbeus]